jgi:TolB-like protein/Tfp pilus assembly protein PilF
MTLSAGTCLGPYEILTPLGAGSMGEVYKARDTRLGRIVAIKVLASHVSDDPRRKARFDREARAISRLTHPHICTLHDVGYADGVDYLVLEYLEGQTLAGRLQRGPLPPDQLLKAGIEIGEGLEWAHHEGIIHRDLKSANVMLTKTGAKLLDFGLAKASSESDSDRLEVPTNVVDPTLTDPGTVMGTLSYMAPEQLEGKKADTRTDIFALGVLLYEMATGKKPFAGTSRASLIGSILKDQPAPLTDLTPMAPPALDRLIRQCLEKDPEERRHSVHDVVKELKWIRDDSKAAMTPVSGAALAVRPEAKAWLLAGAVVATVLATVVALHPWRKAAGPLSGFAVPVRIAVLPFENQGTPETDYFAEGMSDQVRGKLASLPGFEVVASTTSSQYKKTTKAIEQVARELEVRYLVVGKVRWDKAPGGGRVQVIPELVEVEQSGAATEKWGQPFDAGLTDVFQVQTEIAGKVAQALGVALSAGQQGALAEKLTQNLAAYDAFLRGDMAYRRESWREAAKAYEQAVKLDPNFALAWAHLSRAHSAWYEFSTAADAKIAQEAAERAIALAPERPDGYLARAQHYAFIENDSAQGLVEIEHAERLGPRDVDVLNRKARLERNLGRFEEALRVFEQAKQLDPRSIATARDLVDTFSYLRRYPEAQTEADRARALDPTDLSALAQRVAVSIDQGDLTGAQAVLRAASKEIEPAQLVISVGVWLLDDAQQQLLLTLGPDRFDNDRADWALTRARTYSLRGDPGKTRESAELARAELETQLHAAPKRAWLHMSHALALAYLGRKAEAIAEGEQVAGLLPVTTNAISWPENQQALANIYLLTGENEKALDRLEPLLTIPNGPSPGRLRIDPTFAPLRGNPRFDKLARGQQ